jgi:hypothetical protein
MLREKDATFCQTEGYLEIAPATLGLQLCTCNPIAPAKDLSAPRERILKSSTAK